MSGPETQRKGVLHLGLLVVSSPDARWRQGRRCCQGLARRGLERPLTGLGSRTEGSPAQWGVWPLI